MKLVISLGTFLFVLSFCNIGERISKLTSSDAGDAGVSQNEANAVAPKQEEIPAVKPELNAAQREIVEDARKIRWEEQGIAFNLPKNWKEMNSGKASFNYGSPDLAFLIGTVSPLPDTMPLDVTLRSNYESALDQLKNGKYENVRYLEIDGIKGVEFVEAMPEQTEDQRRHQWIGFRNYLGQKQQLNLMLTTKGSNFDKHRDDFSAILYTAEIKK